MIDEATVTRIAAQTNIPPAILYALTQAPGQALDTADSLTQTATHLAQLFTKDGSWEAALSDMIAGDPGAYQSPTSSVGGQVSYIMGIAGARPTYGMAGYVPSNPAQFTAGSRAFGTSITGMSQYGGVVTSGHASQWYASANGARINAYQASAGRAPESAQAPFTFESMPFPNADLNTMSEDFGDRSGPGGYAEQGNDYALPHGTPLTAAISGTVKVVVPSDPHSNTGLTVYIVRPDGSKMYYGHLAGNPSDLPVKDGQFVEAGQPIGAVGGDPSKDPYPGNSTGSHTEIGVYDSRGVLYDPRPMLEAAQPLGQRRANDPSPQESQQQQPQADPATVAQFATRLQAMNVEPEQFIRDFPGVSKIRRRLMGEATTLDEYSRYAGMDIGTTTKAVRSEPHPVYPEYTVGQLHDTYMASQLAAAQYGGRPTTLFEASRLTAAGAQYNDLVRHFGYQNSSTSVQDSSGRVRRPQGETSE